MKDMKRDEFLEEKLNSYVEGSAEPNVDLSAAKRALTEQQAGRRSAKRRMWIALASACASLILVAVVLFNILPVFRAGSDKDQGSADAPQGGNYGPAEDLPDEGDSEADPPPGSSGSSGTEVVRFTLAETKQRAAGVGELSETYGTKLKKLTDFGFSSGVATEYTLYYVEEEAVLLGTELVYSQAGKRVSATVYTDLSGGKYRAEELGEYDALPQKSATYTFKQTFLNGEYVYLGNFFVQGAEYCVSLQSSYEPAFVALMEYLI